MCHLLHNLWLPLCSVPASGLFTALTSTPQSPAPGHLHRPCPASQLLSSPGPLQPRPVHSVLAPFPPQLLYSLPCTLHHSSSIQLSQSQRPFQAGQLLSVVSTSKLLCPAEALIARRGLTLMWRHRTQIHVGYHGLGSEMPESHLQPLLWAAGLSVSQGLASRLSEG